MVEKKEYEVVLTKCENVLAENEKEAEELVIHALVHQIEEYGIGDIFTVNSHEIKGVLDLNEPGDNKLKDIFEPEEYKCSECGYKDRIVTVYCPQCKAVFAMNKLDPALNQDPVKAHVEESEGHEQDPSDYEKEKQIEAQKRGRYNE